jgi:hypothetical protein
MASMYRPPPLPVRSGDFYGLQGMLSKRQMFFSILIVLLKIQQPIDINHVTVTVATVCIFMQV